MNIITEIENIFGVEEENLEFYEKSKYVNINFCTQRNNLPQVDSLLSFFNKIPNRDLIELTINFYDDEIKRFSKVHFENELYISFIELFDLQDECKINIEIKKRIEESMFSVYLLEVFAENISKDNFINNLEFFSSLLINQKKLYFQCLEFDDLFWKTKTIAFIGLKSKEKYRLKNRISLLTNIKENCNCTTLEKYHLLPEDFKIDIDIVDNKLSALFSKLATFLSIIYLSSFSTINKESFNCEIIGQRNIVFIDDYNSLKYNEQLYKIYEWVYTEGNIIDKLLIARNVISLHCKYVKLIDLDERTFESIKANHQLYLKDNVSKYIEAKESVSKFIVDIVSQIDENISKLTGELKNNFIALAGFFITVFLVNVASEQPLNNIFTKDVTKIFEIIIIFSIAYLFISVFYSKSRYKRQIKAFDLLKYNYADFLSEFETNEIFNQNKEFLKVKKDYKKHVIILSIIWAVLILITFIITENVGDDSFFKCLWNILKKK